MSFAAAHPLFKLSDAHASQVPHTRALNRFGREPMVLRGAASDWPATSAWTFEYLASVGGQQPVQLVVGNREAGHTKLVKARLDEYLLSLERKPSPNAFDAGPAYLKEFDLLQRIPELAPDVRPGRLIPRRQLSASSAWIGPRGAHTGLHYDHLDNVAVLLRGAKRFFLAPPGTVEKLGAVSPKFDRWARLSSLGIAGLVAQGLPRSSLFVADLAQGDALYVPRGWWHEVINTEPSIFLGGFFGSYPRVIGKWLSTGMQQVLHDARALTGRTDCTCHSHR